jgi:hypothetical protein
MADGDFLGLSLPYAVQQRAWDAAFVLRQDFSDRLDLATNIRMEVIQMVAPERLGWTECGDALATYALVTEVRV